MGFSVKQLSALKRNPPARFVRTRLSGNKELCYLEGWYAVREANRIFGFDGWSRETLETRCVLAREARGHFLAIYIARVRITVKARGATIIREGHGSGEGRGPSAAEVHDIALKAAETDATKRALATFGRPFGLELYRSDKVSLPHSPPLSPAATTPVAVAPSTQTKDYIGSSLHPDDGTPIPRPSRYYGERTGPSMLETMRQDQQQLAAAKGPATVAPPLAPNESTIAPANRVDKSQLAIAEPRRLRDKAHLKFVATQPCLVCGRQPSDPHHLRFAQPRAIGMKVSDEFTVPLCRGHHRELHRYGDERVWWDRQKLEPLDVAAKLWRQSHPLPAISQPSASRGAATVSAAARQNEPPDPTTERSVVTTPQNDETKPIVPSASR